MCGGEIVGLMRHITLLGQVEGGPGYLGDVRWIRSMWCVCVIDRAVQGTILTI
jgi:hypothetical protein